MMVLGYAKDGNLRNYFKKDFLNLNWQEKYMLCTITSNLLSIHDLEFNHKDLHSGNIHCDSNNSYISDFGLSQSINNNSSLSVCGVLPYIASEILDKKPYTFASDVYSIGIIMIEMSTRKPPYGNVLYL